MFVTGWVNIYKSGKYHTPGKPGAYDRHPGDIYATRAAAIADIDTDPKAGYVDTVRIDWRETYSPKVNDIPLRTFQPGGLCGRVPDDI